MKRLPHMVLVACICLTLSCQREVERGVERGVEKAATRRIDTAVYGGEKIEGEDFEDYMSNLSFEVLEVRPVPEQDKAMIVGKCTNSGKRNVSYLKVDFIMLSGKNEEMANKVDLLAHNLPFGDNNRPIIKKSSRRFIIEVSPYPDDWDGKGWRFEIIEMAFQK